MLLEQITEIFEGPVPPHTASFSRAPVRAMRIQGLVSSNQVVARSVILVSNNTSSPN